LGQLLQVIPNIKHYIFNPVPSKPSLPYSIVTLVTIDHQMAVIHVQVRKNFIKDVLLNGGYGINIITDKLRAQLGLSKLKPAPYNLCMADQTIAKPLGLVKDLITFVHGIPYVVTFIVIQNSVLDFSYSMLLGHPWLKDVKVFHDWGNNTIIIKELVS
jgi:hypothetical protein